MKRKPAKNTQYISRTGEFAHIYHDSFGKEDAKNQPASQVCSGLMFPPTKANTMFHKNSRGDYDLRCVKAHI